MGEMHSDKMKRHRTKMSTMVLKYARSDTTTLYSIGAGPKEEWFAMLKKRPSLKVFGCEPDPRTYAQIEEAFPGTLWPVAIAKTPEAALNLFGSYQETSRFVPRGGCYTNRETLTIEAWTLDEFDVRCGAPNGIILWMDIEGMELEALQTGTTLLMSGRVHVINVEARSTPLAPGACTEDDVTQLLERCGYDLKKRYNNQHTHWDVIYMPRAKDSQ